MYRFDLIKQLKREFEIKDRKHNPRAYDLKNIND